MKFNIFLYFVILIFAISLQAMASNQEAETKMLDSYIKIQELLSKDQTDGVTEATANLVKNTKNIKIKKSAEKLSVTKNISEMREAFKEVSAEVITSFNSKVPIGFEIVSCSMAQSKWIQRSGSVSNPYYGSKMLKCGEKE